MVIDSHQHLWKYDPARHAWIDEDMANIRKDFLPTDLETTFAENDIDGSVAVQADQTLAETDFLLACARQTDRILGVVGWADLRDPDVEKVLEGYQHEKKLKGFRHIVQGEPDPNFLLRPDFMRGIGKLALFGYTYDILVFPHQLGATLEFVKRFPDQKFVIDHIAKPYIKDGFFDGWAILMREIAKQENVSCKLSGMITEAGYTTWTPDQIRPYMAHTLDVFGSKRVMYGSDWPVCLVAGSYGKVKQLVTDFIAPLSPDEQADIMGRNARSFYNL